jgi:hypothetical protein
MHPQIEKIRIAIEPLRQQIISHKVYSVINTPEDLKVFMQYHVFAVWDFMSLLKALQTNLTCTTAPWFPVGLAETRYLINEIVLGEESDVDQAGVRKSHFELYLEAMQQIGADTDTINNFMDVLKTTSNLKQAFATANAPEAVEDFVNFTFNIIDGGKTHLQSAVFTFGREDLIPNMFLSIVNDLSQKFPDSISIFKYYLERHIEVDGDHHSHLALQMTESLCQPSDAYWQEAEAAVKEALQQRIYLWDGVYNQIVRNGKIVRSEMTF